METKNWHFLFAIISLVAGGLLLFVPGFEILGVIVMLPGAYMFMTGKFDIGHF